MYLEHFGLREYPFSITPDTEYFFSSGSSQEAINTLLIAAKTGEGFVKITGEVGTGKSTLCRKLIGSLGPDFRVAYVPNPYLEPQTLFMEIASELGIAVYPSNPPSQSHLLRLLNERLIELNRQGKRVVVCLDEAQAMPIETLEALRLLTNLETEKRKLLQVIVFGQPELENKLNHPSIRQLKQRIAFSYRLGSMHGDEVDYYIHHRLSVAGHTGSRIFTRAALWWIRVHTRCVPRLVNIIAHKAMLAAYGKGKKMVTFADVDAAVNDTDSVSPLALRLRMAVLVLALIGSAGLLIFDKGYFA